MSHAVLGSCVFFLSIHYVGIATVAVEVMYDKEALKYCRKDSIMADAAYVMLTRDSRKRTGEFLYDEEVLTEEGIMDFTQYLVSPGGRQYANTAQ